MGHRNPQMYYYFIPVKGCLVKTTKLFYLKFRFPPIAAKMSAGVGGGLKFFWTQVNNWKTTENAEQ